MAVAPSKPTALADEEITRPMQRQRGLLLDRLDRDEAHARSGDRLADRLRIAGISLAPLHIGLDVGRRHQPHLVTETDQLSPNDGSCCRPPCRSDTAGA